MLYCLPIVWSWCLTEATQEKRQNFEILGGGGWIKAQNFFLKLIISQKERRSWMNPEQLEAEIMKLNLDSRAKLAERIILSLDAPSDEENLRLWVLEAERRLKELREGKAREIPSEEVFRRARTAILCGR
jgi:putative addiction module component (TIGR02574 family)